MKRLMKSLITCQHTMPIIKETPNIPQRYTLTKKTPSILVLLVTIKICFEKWWKDSDYRIPISHYNWPMMYNFFLKCIFILFAANGNQNSQDHCHKNSRGRKGYGIMSQCHSRL